MVNIKSDGKAILAVFIGSIIAITFMISIGDSIFVQTNEVTVVNTTVTAPAVNATLDLLGRTLVSQTAVTEASNVSNVSSGLFLQTGTATNGLQTVQLVVNDTAGQFSGTSVNVSYVMQPDGYLAQAGARSIAALILIFGSLAIMIFVIVVFIKDGSLGEMMRSK